MPILINCQSCGCKLRIPDTLIGSKVKCPRCSTILVASESLETPPDHHFKEEQSTQTKERHDDSEADEGQSRPKSSSGQHFQVKPSSMRKHAPSQEANNEDDQTGEEDDKGQAPLPRRRSQHEDDEDEDDRNRVPQRRRIDWSKTRLGITLVLAATLVTVANYVVTVVGIIVLLVMYSASLSASSRSGGGGGGAVMAGLAGLGVVLVFSCSMMLAAIVLKLVGHIFCLGSPQRQGARTLAIVTLSLVGAATLLYFLTILLGFVEGGLRGTSPLASAGGAHGVASIVNVLSNMISLAGFIVFMFFLRAVALAARGQDLARMLFVF